MSDNIPFYMQYLYAIIYVPWTLTPLLIYFLLHFLLGDWTHPTYFYLCSPRTDTVIRVLLFHLQQRQMIRRVLTLQGCFVEFMNNSCSLVPTQYGHPVPSLNRDQLSTGATLRRSSFFVQWWSWFRVPRHPHVSSQNQRHTHINISCCTRKPPTHYWLWLAPVINQAGLLICFLLIKTWVEKKMHLTGSNFFPCLKVWCCICEKLTKTLGYGYK